MKRERESYGKIFLIILLIVVVVFVSFYFLSKYNVLNSPRAPVLQENPGGETEEATSKVSCNCVCLSDGKACGPVEVFDAHIVVGKYSCEPLEEVPCPCAWKDAWGTSQDCGTPFVEKIKGGISLPPK